MLQLSSKSRSSLRSLAMSCSLPRFEAVKQLLKNIRANSLLDLGCGNGELTVEIARIVDSHEIYEVDIDDKALEAAKAKGIKVFRLDLSKDPIPLPSESIDLVTALEIIEHLMNPNHMLREAYRVLRKGVTS